MADKKDEVVLSIRLSLIHIQMCIRDRDCTYGIQLHGFHEKAGLIQKQNRFTTEAAAKTGDRYKQAPRFCGSFVFLSSEVQNFPGICE